MAEQKDPKEVHAMLFHYFGQIAPVCRFELEEEEPNFDVIVNGGQRLVQMMDEYLPDGTYKPTKTINPEKVQELKDIALEGMVSGITSEQLEAVLSPYEAFIETYAVENGLRNSGSVSDVAKKLFGN